MPRVRYYPGYVIVFPRALLCTVEELLEVASQELRSAYIRVS
jgi:hypothetical protein